MTTRARILTVCTGNVCRSPYLERALQTELDRSWGPGEVEVTSGGTGALAANPVDEGSRVLMDRRGYPSAGFVARRLLPEHVASADLVLTATRAHRGQVATLHPRALRYVFAFREFADLLAGIDPAELHASSGSASEHVQRVVALAAGQRGMRPPLSDAEADIIDPYRRGPEVFEQMAREIDSALPPVVAALGRP
ncbi:low molecular weight phosphatase family protein [Pedococcus sp. NPDC057267]|uniref:arsenate reductase/protein-tyrosine-phosphatase family protein n=1 Tax=Pedococcus sp. NPDC057267 TaxID=3346077 RepID=UPI00362BEB45